MIKIYSRLPGDRDLIISKFSLIHSFILIFLPIRSYRILKDLFALCNNVIYYIAYYIANVTLTIYTVTNNKYICHYCLLFFIENR